MRLSKSLVLLSVFFLFTACTQKKNKGKDNGSPQEVLTPTATAPKLDHTKDFSTGNASAPIVIEYFADLQCGACKALSPKLEEIMANPTYKDKLLLVFKNFAKDASCSDYTGQYLHEFSCEAAVAARCVGLYQDKFWEYKEKLIAGDLKAFSLAGFKTLALEFGISEADYNACNADKAVMEKVKADYAEGKQRGVTGTPTIFVNKKKAKFPVAKQDIEAEINALLK
jgi:protein-disulfide isomerase